MSESTDKCRAGNSVEIKDCMDSQHLHDLISTKA
jgi:hypothetical protein